MSVANKTISEKTTELNEMVAWFDSDEFNLEAALDKFKQESKESDAKRLMRPSETTPKDSQR